MRKYISIILLSLSVYALLAFLINFFSLDWKWFDYISWFQNKQISKSKDIVLITVDEKTVDRYSDPSFWTRSRYESLLNDLKALKPKAIVFDYYFSNKALPENVDWDLLWELSGMDSKKVDNLFYSYNERIADESFISSIDRDFVMSVRKAWNVFFPYLLSLDKDSNAKGIKIDIFKNLKDNTRSWYVNIIPDKDWTIRRFPDIKAKSYSPLNLEVARFAKGDIANSSLDWSVRYMRFADISKWFYKIPFDYAYNWIFEDREGNKVDIKDKVVIIGDYWALFWDYYKVSSWNQMPWIEILATQIRNLLEDSYITDIGKTNRIISIFTLFLLLVIVYIALPWFVFWSLVFILVNAVFVFLDFRFLNANLYMSYISFVPMLFGSFFWVYFIRLYDSLWERLRIKRFFTRYVGKNIVDMLISKKDLNLEWESRDVTVFFADIKNFTSLSEKLSPEEVVTILNDIFKISNEIIFKNGWTLDKYIWDAIMAFWGAPLKNPEHAKIACISALEFIKAINWYKSDKIGKLEDHLTFRIGINSWNVTVWSIWTSDFSDYTVIWDNVNLASRLEWINKSYNTNIIITQDTLNLLDDSFLVRELDIIRVKGKDNPVTIFELLDHAWEYCQNKEIPKIIKNHSKWLDLYRKWKLLEAKAFFKENKSLGDEVALAFIDRINSMDIKWKNWDWIWNFETK